MADGTKTNKETESTQKLLLWTIDGNMSYRFQYSAAGHIRLRRYFELASYRLIDKSACLSNVRCGLLIMKICSACF